MAIDKNNTKYSIEVVYKPSFDTSGNLDLASYSKTFNKVAETATVEQLYNFGVALMSLTVYSVAPFVINMIDTSELVPE